MKKFAHLSILFVCVCVLSFPSDVKIQYLNSGGGGAWRVVRANSKQWFTTSFLQPLPYQFSYAIRSRKLSANEQFFVGAQTVVSLLQTTQIISHVCFITDHVAYASSNKTKIVWIETELSFLPGVDASRVYVRAWALGWWWWVDA